MASGEGRGGKPQGVTEESWLPVHRGDHDNDIIVRLYDPDPAKFKT